MSQHNDNTGRRIDTSLPAEPQQYSAPVHTISCKAYSDFLKRTTVELKFEAEGMIGQGTFGKVHRITRLVVDDDTSKSPPSDKRFALKVVHQDPLYCHRELEILEDLRGHPNLINLMYSYFTRFENKIYLNLIMNLLYSNLYLEIYQSGTRSKPQTKLSYYMDAAGNQTARITFPFHIPEEKHRRWTRDILRGLGFMHEKNIIHRDLKPENVAFTKTGTAQIIDMGSAKQIKYGQANSTEICTLLYRAPELLLGNNVYTDCGMDLWAVACIMIEMILGKPLFYGNNKLAQFKEIMSFIGPPPRRLMAHTAIDMYRQITKGPTDKEQVSVQRKLRKSLPHINVAENQDHQHLELLLLEMLRYENRPEAYELLKSEFFKGIREDSDAMCDK